MKKTYVAEFIGTFLLSFIVLLSVSVNGAIMATPILAGITLLVLVYAFGHISGPHLNPAVTIALLTLKKVSAKDAIGYIVAQLIAGAAVLLVARVYGVVLPSVGQELSLQLLLAEFFGALVFGMGIATVVFGKVKDETSGIVIGGALFLGLMFASFMGSAGILNPAVAIALNSVSLVYVLSPIIGMIAGMQIYKKFA
jgi:glycerol uptake facilitator-like aquaporin